MSNIELKGLKGLRFLNEKPINKTSSDQVEHIDIDFLAPGKYQPRKSIDKSMLEELSDSIKAQGIIQPLIVRKSEQQKYEIIAGERRWHAAKIAGLKVVPAIVREIDDNVAFAFAIIENIQRENLNPIEEALAYSRFRDEFSLTHEEIAKMVGRSRVSITNTLRVLLLEPNVIKLLEEGLLTIGHAKTLLCLENEDQAKIASTIVEQDLSVRDTERLVNSLKKDKVSNIKKDQSVTYSKCEEWSRIFTQILSAKVSVKMNNKGYGKLVINFDSPEEIERLFNDLRKD